GASRAARSWAPPTRRSRSAAPRARTPPRSWTASASPATAAAGCWCRRLISSTTRPPTPERSEGATRAAPAARPSFLLPLLQVHPCLAPDAGRALRPAGRGGSRVISSRDVPAPDGLAVHEDLDALARELGAVDDDALARLHDDLEGLPVVAGRARAGGARDAVARAADLAPVVAQRRAVKLHGDGAPGEVPAGVGDAKLLGARVGHGGRVVQGDGLA